MIGTTLQQRYRIESELGRGGMGEVYRATDVHSGEVVAVKALNAEVLAREPELLARFIREGEALRLLNHPNIVRMIAAVEENGRHYLVMEFVEGGSLHDVLASRKSLPASEVIKIALEVSDALSRAHHLGIIHRDLKPANVLIAKDGTPRLADFGIAHIENDQHLTKSGVLVGTVDYISPEVCQGERPDERSDIWAFGVILFEMLSGRLPFEGNTLTSRLTAILTHPVPDLAQLVPDVSSSFVNLINRMLEKDPQQRIPSVRLIGAELEAMLKGREMLTPVSFVPMLSPEEIGRDNLTGRSIRGYALGALIGSGGMGAVYRATQKQVEREVAVKIILPKYANHPDFIRRFEAEAQLVARLEHPHIVPLYDYWREPSVAYLVMRLLRGGNLQSLLRGGKTLSPEATLRLMEQIGSALSAAHRAGIVHRDIKPANILLDEDRNAYLADFGIAKNLGNYSTEAQPGIVFGSPDYISPEQIRSELARPQTDIYSLGVMLYELLTGSVPFHGLTSAEVMQQHLNNPLPSIAVEALDEVIKHATAKDSAQRYATVEQMLRDLRKALSAEPIERKSAPADSGQTTASTTKIALTEFDNPYKGLRVFDEGDTQDFFGREALTQQLLARLAGKETLARFLAVVGPSGSGKSSVVKAGLIPALRNGALVGSQNWFIIEMMPGSHPLEELEAALLRVAVNPPASLIEQFQADSRGLVRAVRRSLPDDPNIELVLVIDQFEEVFTLLQDESERVRFLGLLATAIQDETSRIRIILTLRADFLDRPLGYAELADLLRQRMEIVVPLTSDELERAIVSPAQRVGLLIEPGLVAAILHDLVDQPGALPLLQFALSELFEKRAGNTLTRFAYQSIGGVLGALGRRAESIYEDLNEDGQAAARQLFLRLITLGEGTEDTRRRVLRTELESLKTSEVIDVFGKARLLSFDRDPITRGATVEVAHEAIIREWGRLRNWLNESRADVRMQRQLAIAAKDWQTAKQDESFLLFGAHLEQFEGWALDTSVALAQDESAFLSASILERDRRGLEEQVRQKRELEAAQKLAETERQSALRLRSRNRMISGALVLAIILAGVALFFGYQSRQNAAEAQKNAAVAQQNADTADANAKQAESQKRIATSRELAAAALSNLEIDPERSILLALQAEATVHTIESENALHRSILASRLLLVIHHGTYNMGVAYSPDGRRIATATLLSAAKIWDANTGELLLSLNGHAGGVESVVFSPDGTRIATSGDDGTAKVWDAADGKKLLTLTGHLGWVYNVNFSPDGTRLVTASEDKTAKVWDAASGKELLTFSSHRAAVYDVAFSPDGKRIASSGADGNVRVWDANTGKELLTLPVKMATALYGVAFSPDGKRLTAVSDTDISYIKTWDSITGAVLFSGNLGHTAPLRNIVFSKDGTLAATAGDDQKVKVWDSATGQVLYTFSGHTYIINSLAFSPDSLHLATASWDGTVRIWSLAPRGEAFFIPFANTTTSTWSWTLDYSPDGMRLLTGYTDANARIWDAVTGKELLQLIGQNTNNQPTAYSSDGKMAAAANADNSITVWDAQTGKQRIALAGHKDKIYKVVFSPDGTRLISASKDYKAITWDLVSGKALHTFYEYSEIFSVAYSPDGKHIITSNNSQEATLWDADTGKRIFTLFSPVVSAITYSPDGKLVALGSFDGTTAIWNPLTGKKLWDSKDQNSAITEVRFSPDGKLLATANRDGTAHVWDVESGVNFLTLYADSGGAGGVSFSPDGKRLAVGGKSGISIFYLQIEDVIALAKSRLTRALTTEECQQYLHVDTCPTP